MLSLAYCELTGKTADDKHDVNNSRVIEYGYLL